MARTVNLLTIHCSATASGKSISRGKVGVDHLNAAQVINAWHAARGFQRTAAARAAFNPTLTAIGYHYVIDVTGEVFTGRADDEVGAHAAGYNAFSLGVCLVGGAEREGQYTAAQWKSLKTTVLMLMMKHGFPLQPPQRIVDPKRPQAADPIRNGVCGHRDLSPDINRDGLVKSGEWLKTCPGFDVAAWLAAGMRPHPANVYPEQQP